MIRRKRKKEKENKPESFSQRKGRAGLRIFSLSVVFGTALFFGAGDATATCDPCGSSPCSLDDCATVEAAVRMQPPIWQPIINQNIIDHFNAEEQWIFDNFIRDFVIKGLAEMTEYLSNFGMYQVEIVGALLDAKNQVETTRLFWQLAAEAHRDYHPSDDFCWYGTNSRSMVASETRGRYNALALAEWGLARQLGNANVNAARGSEQDQEGRWQQFAQTFCDTKDNNWVEAGSGLDLACDHDGAAGGATGATDKKRMNIDVDYTRAVDMARTIEFNLSDGTLQDGDADILAMASNLYGHEVLSRNLSRMRMDNLDSQNLYFALRSVAAKRSVAQNTFNAIVGMKSSGTSDTGTGASVNTREFLAAAIKDLVPPGTSNSDIIAMIGENPSYYAQLEVLGKKIYENPDYFANLYDTRANVARKRVAMKAVGLLLDRALYESEIRQELVMSVLLSSRMRDQYRKLNRELPTVKD